MFTNTDLQLLQQKGIKVDDVLKQIDNFKNGFPFAELTNAATIENGIIKCNEDEVSSYCSLYDKELVDKDVLKFVPASGAATRMFKDLFEFENQYKTGDELNKYAEVQKFINGIHNFAFYNDLNQCFLNKGNSADELINKGEYVQIINTLLHNTGLNYGQLPKALLKFHEYVTHTRTSLEEHLVEGNDYTKNKNKRVKLHFTVSEEHMKLVQEKIEDVKCFYEKMFDAVYEISFSVQKASTDTIAVTENNELFRGNDGQLLFRPAGHGALIQNLNEQHADLIFIKNIDNVVPDRLKSTTYAYKKVIGGILLKLQQQVFYYLQCMERGISIKMHNEIEQFLQKQLYITLPDKYSKLSEVEKIKFLHQKLNRPMRACGMVKNVGEPGGGPFWVKNTIGEISLQIVESSQVDKGNKQQELIFKNATHFNPVDLVCAIKDYKGNNFNLLDYVDQNTGFISLKSKDGMILKAQELPGLWNGAMADWITLFVEVPLLTFNPVKTVNDLLRVEHQREL